MALYPEDQLDNSNPTDDLLPGDSIFAVPLVRLEGVTDEMAEGMVIDPKFLPSFADINTLIGELPIEVTENGDGSYTISIVLDDFILHSDPSLQVTPPPGDCSKLIATTEFICDAITASCNNIGQVDGEPNKFDFLDCDGNPFQIEVARNTVVESPARVFTFTDSVNGSTTVWDVRNNTFTDDGAGLHTWTNPVDGTTHSFTLTAAAIPVDVTQIPCLDPGVTTIEEALAGLCAVIGGLVDRFITMTPDGEGALVLADATNGDSYPVMQACSEQRLTDIIPDGSKLVICTPNDGSYVTDIANVVKIDCSIIVNTDIVPADSKVIICTPSDGLFKTDLAALFNCQLELEEGEGIDIDVQDPSGLCTLKRYVISVDVCEFSQVTNEDVDAAAFPYWIMCVDGANAKISMQDMQDLFQTNSWIDGLGTVLSGTGHPGTPYKIDLDISEIAPDVYDVDGDFVIINSGATQVRVPVPTNGVGISIDATGAVNFVPCTLPETNYDQNAKNVVCANGTDAEIVPAIKAGANVTIAPDGTLSVTIPDQDSIVFVNGGTPVALFSTGGEVPIGDLPLNWNINVSAHVPASAKGIVVRTYTEVDLDDVFSATEVALFLYGKQVNGSENGGDDGKGDNSSWNDAIVPFTSPNVAIDLTLNYGVNGSTQAIGVLVAYYP